MHPTERVADVLELTFLVKPVEGEFEALCLELDIASCAHTQAEVVESLLGLVQLYVTDCVEAGEVPIPRRPVPQEALREFLFPADPQSDVQFTAHHQSVPVHAYR